MSRHVAMQRARHVREQMRADAIQSGHEFTQADFRARVLDACADLAATALEGLAFGVAEAVDREAVRSEPHAQTTLWDLSGDYALGDGRRFPRAGAFVEHMEESLRIDGLNLERLQQASTRKHQEYERLLPYWGPGVSKQQAVAAYLLANPGESLPDAGRPPA